MSTLDNPPGRKWWPAEYMDEVMPTGRDSPDAWLIKLPDGGFEVASPYHGSDISSDQEAEAEWRYKPLTNGERVDFTYYDDLGDVEVTVNPDGSYELHGSIDPKANYFAEQFNWESMEHDIGTFAKNYAETLKAAERITVCTGYWATSVVVLSLKIDGDKASLEQAGTA